MKVSMKTRLLYRIPLLLLLAVLLASGVTAQSVEPARADDPVKRALERIEAAVNGRAATAERALTASQLVNDGVEARKQGKSEEARAALRQAEVMIAASAPAEQGLLTEELLRRIAEEQATLNPSATRTLAKQGWPGLKSTGNIPRLVLARYNAHRDTLMRILLDEGLPLEVLSVALIESGFNALALSPKGARGIWQLMPDTARRYGLAVSLGNDHRTHPEHATIAAARYLRDLYRMFGDWKLALAAYNAGEGRVQRAIERAGVRDFDELARRRLLPAETRSYVPAVLAAWSQMTLAQAAQATQLAQKESER